MCCKRIEFINIRGDNPNIYYPRLRGTTLLKRILRMTGMLVPTLGLYLFKSVLGMKYDLGYDYYIPLGASFGMWFIFAIFSFAGGWLNKFDRYRIWEYFMRWCGLMCLHLICALGTAIGLMFSKYISLLIPISSCFELFIVSLMGVVLWIFGCLKSDDSSNDVDYFVSRSDIKFLKKSTEIT